MFQTALLSCGDGLTGNKTQLQPSTFSLPGNIDFHCSLSSMVTCLSSCTSAEICCHDFIVGCLVTVQPPLHWPKNPPRNSLAASGPVHVEKCVLGTVGAASALVLTPALDRCPWFCGNHVAALNMHKGHASQVSQPFWKQVEEKQQEGDRLRIACFLLQNLLFMGCVIESNNLCFPLVKHTSFDVSQSHSAAPKSKTRQGKWDRLEIAGAWRCLAFPLPCSLHHWSWNLSTHLKEETRRESELAERCPRQKEMEMDDGWFPSNGRLSFQNLTYNKWKWKENPRAMNSCFANSHLLCFCLTLWLLLNRKKWKTLM